MSRRLAFAQKTVEGLMMRWRLSSLGSAHRITPDVAVYDHATPFDLAPLISGACSLHRLQRRRMRRPTYVEITAVGLRSTDLPIVNTYCM